MEPEARRGLLNRTYSIITLPGQTERTPARGAEVRCASMTGRNRRRVVVIVKMTMTMMVMMNIIMIMMMVSMLMFKQLLLMSMVE